MACHNVRWCEPPQHRVIGAIGADLQHEQNWRYEDDDAPKGAEENDNTGKPLRLFEQQGSSNEGKATVENDYAVAQSVDVAVLKQGALLGSYRRAVGWTDETRELRGIDRSYLLFGH